MSPVDRDDLGFLLAKATQHWNELLAERFAAWGYGEVSPSYGSVLLPLYEEDGLRMGELAMRARLSKQTMTQMIARLERDKLVARRADPADGRATLIYLTARARQFEPVAAAFEGQLHRATDAKLNQSAQEAADGEASIESCGPLYQFDVTVSFESVAPANEAPRGSVRVPASLGGGS